MSASAAQRCASSKAEPLPHTKESYQQSGLTLWALFLVSVVATGLFDETDLVRTCSLQLKHAIWATPNLVAYVCVGTYFVMVMWHIYVRSTDHKKAAKHAADEPGSTSTQLLICWNWALVLLSMIMLSGLGRGAWRVIREHGMVAYICDGDLAWGGNTPFGFYMALFLLSKFPELLDTVFLVVRGRNVVFLHWYHHISVLLYCWLVTQTRYPGTPFSVINSFVHSIMYYYYARMAQGVKPAFARVITQIQLAQMVAGLVLNAAFMILNNQLPHSVCNGGNVISEMGMLNAVYAATGFMYLSYFLLFFSFYLEKYWSQKNK